MELIAAPRVCGRGGLDPVVRIAASQWQLPGRPFARVRIPEAASLHEQGVPGRSQH